MIVRAGAVAAAALLSAGCIAVRHVPRTAPAGVPARPAVSLDSVTTADRQVLPGVHRPRITSGPFHRVEVTREGMVDGEQVPDQVEQHTLVAVRLEAAVPIEVAGMWFGEGTSAPCQGGHRDIAMSVDGDIRWDRPLVVSGTHVVAGRFEEDRPLLDRPSVVDVRLARISDRRETCVRVPVTGPGIAHGVDKGWSAGARLSYRRALPFDRSSVFALGLSAGHWLGPIRLGLEGFIGGTNELPLAVGVPGTSLCAFLPGSDCSEVSFGGFALESSGIAWREQGLALGWSVSYELLIAKLRRRGADGALLLDRSAVGSGVRVGLQLLRPVAGILGTMPRSPTSAWGIEVFMAAPVVSEGGGAGLTWGIAVLGF